MQPLPMVIMPPVWLLMSEWTAKEASTYHLRKKEASGLESKGEMEGLSQVSTYLPNIIPVVRVGLL